MARAVRLRRDRPRRDAARARTASTTCRALRDARRLDAGPDADRARRGREPDRGPRHRRGRLPVEAVLVRRAARAAARARAARAGRAAGRCSRPATCGSTRPRTAPGAATTELELSSKEFALLEVVHAPPGPGALAAAAARERLGHRLREPLEPRRRLRPLPAPEDRPAVRPRTRSRRCGASATGCGRTADEPAADPPAADARLHARDGGRARRDELLRLRARRRARCSRRSTRACAGRRSTSRTSTADGSTSTRAAGGGDRRGAPSRRSHRQRRPARAAAAAGSPTRAAASPQGERDAPLGSTWPGCVSAGACSPSRRRFEDGRGRWSSARSLAARDETLDHLLDELVRGRAAGAVAGGGRRLRARSRGAAPGRADAARAEAISGSTPGARLPEPPARDEISRLAETLNAMLARLEAALEHERRFVADASHELRTPLALLKTELEVALRRPRSREELEQALRSASEETERLTRLAEDLLLIARSDAGGLPDPRRERVPAAEVLDTVAERFAGAAGEQGRTVEVVGRRTVSCSTPTRCGWSRRSGTSSTTRSPTAAAGSCSRLRRATSRVELHVEDEGPGFPPRSSPRAFERFSRAAEGRSGARQRTRPLDRRADRARPRRRGRRAQPSGGGADVWIAVERAILRRASTLAHRPLISARHPGAMQELPRTPRARARDARPARACTARRGSRSSARRRSRVPSPASPRTRYPATRLAAAAATKRRTTATTAQRPAPLVPPTGRGATDAAAAAAPPPRRHP